MILGEENTQLITVVAREDEDRYVFEIKLVGKVFEFHLFNNSILLFKKNMVFAAPILNIRNEHLDQTPFIQH